MSNQYAVCLKLNNQSQLHFSKKRKRKKCLKLNKCDTFSKKVGTVLKKNLYSYYLLRFL